MFAEVPPHIFDFRRVAQVLVNLVSSSAYSGSIVFVDRFRSGYFNLTESLPLSSVGLNEEIDFFLSSVLLTNRQFKAELVARESKHSKALVVPVNLVLSHLLIVHFSHSSFGSDIDEEESLGLVINESTEGSLFSSTQGSDHSAPEFVLSLSSTQTEPANRLGELKHILARIILDSPATLASAS